MTVGEMKEIIKDLPDDMPVGLWDWSTDNEEDMNYYIEQDDFFQEDYYDLDDPECEGEPKGKMLFIGFTNKLNENPI